MLGGTTNNCWVGAWLSRSGAVLVLLLLVVVGRAAAPPSEVVGPIDVEHWIRGPVYVMQLDGGSRHGLTPEILEDYLDAAEDLDEHDLLILVLEGHQVGPRFFIETVDFAQALAAQTRVVALAGKVSDGTAALFLAFGERYLLGSSSLDRLPENDFNRQWRVSHGRVPLSRDDGPPSEEILDHWEVGLVKLVLALLSDRFGLSYDRDEQGEVTWRRDDEGAEVVQYYGEGFSIGEVLAIDAGIAQGVVADERALAVALTADREVRLVHLGEDIPRHWMGLFGSADRLVSVILDEVYDLHRQVEDEGTPVDNAILDELEQKLPLLAYWECELGSMAWTYGLLPDSHLSKQYRAFVALMRRTGRPPSEFTREEWKALAAETWPEAAAPQTE
ncbi:MAG: hypothetical protein ACF8NJ_00440 [Phycisphaerales bacterium JB038]